MSDQRLGGMWETLVMGSILSGQAMLTYTWEKKLIQVCHNQRISNTDEEQSGEVKSKAEGVCVCRIYLRYPQGTADVSPLGSCTCCLHGAALLRTQKALRVDAEDARPAQPVSNRHFDDAVTRLWGEGIGTVIINIIHLKLIARQTFI